MFTAIAGPSAQKLVCKLIQRQNIVPGNEAHRGILYADMIILGRSSKV